MKQLKLNKILLITSLVMYFILLIWIISFKCNNEVVISDCIYVYKAKSIIERLSYDAYFYKNVLNIFITVDDLLNILIFMPLGIYLSKFYKNKKFLKGIISAFALTLTLELIQLFTCYGSYSTIDLISNILGYILGYFLYKYLFVRFPLKTENIILFVIVLIAIPFVIYAISNTIIKIDIYNYDNYNWKGI